MRGRGGREAGRDVTRRARQVVMICHAFSFFWGAYWARNGKGSLSSRTTSLTKHFNIFRL